MTSNPQTLRVTARFLAKPDCVQRLCDLLVGLIAPTRAETGCLHYALWQDRQEPRAFTFVEEWVNEQALEEHLKMPHLQHAGACLDELLSEPLELQKFNLVE